MLSTALLLGVLSCSSSSVGPAEQAQIAAIELDPEEVSVEGGRQSGFRVRALDSQGREVVGAPVTFWSSDPSSVVVDGTGTIWSFGEGSFSVVASPGRSNNGKSPPGQVKKSAVVKVTGVAEDRPGRVSDLVVDSVTSGTVHLSFTEVNDGLGGPADYFVRFQIAPISWGDAADVLFGTCSSPLAGSQLGARRSCSVERLQGGVRYEFQVLPFRGSGSGELVYGDLSNVVGAETPTTSWVDLNFERYSSTDDLRAARADFQDGIEDLNLDRIFLDDGVGYSDGGLTHSMRYDWVNQGTKAVSIGRGVRLPEQVKEVWAEIVLRFSDNFTPCNPASPPCAHKTIFMQVVPDGNHRWALYFGGGGAVGPTAPFTMEAPYGETEDGRAPGLLWEDNVGEATQYQDGRWHTLRWHVRHSTTGSSGDAVFEFWIDGVKIYSTVDSGVVFSTNEGTKVHSILLGRNKDKGLDSGTESMWIGRVRAWRDDPGW